MSALDEEWVTDRPPEKWLPGMLFLYRTGKAVFAPRPEGPGVFAYWKLGDIIGYEYSAHCGIVGTSTVMEEWRRDGSIYGPGMRDGYECEEDVWRCAWNESGRYTSKTEPEIFAWHVGFSADYVTLEEKTAEMAAVYQREPL